MIKSFIFFSTTELLNNHNKPAQISVKIIYYKIFCQEMIEVELYGTNKRTTQ